MVWILVMCLFGTLPFLFNAIMRPVESDAAAEPSQHISDEEFLAACSVSDPAVALGVRRIVAECLGLDEHSIHPSHRLAEDLGADQ